MSGIIRVKIISLSKYMPLVLTNQTRKLIDVILSHITIMNIIDRVTIWSKPCILGQYLCTVVMVQDICFITYIFLERVRSKPGGIMNMR